jgi:hypothetical protein
MYIGAGIDADLNGSPFESSYDALSYNWNSPVLVGTFILIVAAAYSDLLWGARERQVFVPIKDLPESVRSGFKYGISVASINTVLTIGMGLFFMFGNPSLPAPIHPADMLGAAVVGPVLILMSYRTKKLAPQVLLLLLYLSGQVSTYLSGQVPSIGAMGIALFYLSGYAKGIAASWSYRNLLRASV